MAITMRSCTSTRAASGRTAAKAVKPFVAAPARARASLRVVAEATDAAAAPAVGIEKSGPNFKALRDINAIMATLPHRYTSIGIPRALKMSR